MAKKRTIRDTTQRVMTKPSRETMSTFQGMLQRLASASHAATATFCARRPHFAIPARANVQGNGQVNGVALIIGDVRIYVRLDMTTYLTHLGEIRPAIQVLQTYLCESCDIVHVDGLEFTGDDVLPIEEARALRLFAGAPTT